MRPSRIRFETPLLPLLLVLLWAVYPVPPLRAEEPTASPSTSVPDEVAGAIAKANAAFSAAFENGDAEAMAQMYTEDGVLLPPGRQGLQRGRTAIARYFTLPPHVEMVDHDLETRSLELKGDTVVEIGTWTSITRREDADAREASGPYLLVWERHPEGRWLIDYDVWQVSPTE